MNPALDANDLLLFARVVEAGSFSRAADRLGLPKSTVSRRVAALERTLGERLLQRTTRQFRLTELGEGVLEHARELAGEVDGVVALVSHRQQQPTGRLRVTMPGDLAIQVLAGAIADFVREFPGVVLELDLSPRRVDLIAEGFDLAIRIGDLPEDASLAARKLAQFQVGLYAAPSYLAGFSAIAQPEQLRAMHGLALAAADGEDRPWELTRSGDGDRERWRGRTGTVTRANSPELLATLAVLGAGVMPGSEFYVRTQVERGTLARVLPDWCLPSVDAWGVFPGRRLLPSRTRLFLEAMARALAPCREPGAV
jgi:DNA-binding transcriptional LysR family regulator